MNNMTREEAMKLAEEVFNEEYSGLDKDSFLIGFQEAYNALTALYKDKFELVRRMREAQIEKQSFKSEMYRKYRGNDWFMSEEELIKEQELYNKVFDLESEIDEYLKKIE